MMPLDPDVSSVRSREDLSRFLAELSQRVRNGTFPVGNKASVDFVAAASSWVGSMDGFYANRGVEMPAEPDWSMIAMVFSAALVYE